MSETKDTADKTLSGGARKPLSLQRTVESGHVRQSFSHGRSKSVVVEKKKTRKLAAPGSAAEAPPAAAPAAPKVEANLSGAGWQADGSESVAVRELATEGFGGNASPAIQVVVHSTDGPVTKGRGADVIDEVTSILEDEPRIADVIAPQPGASLSQDGSTAVVLAGAGADPNEMVRVADDLKGELESLSGDGVEVNPTGASLLWSDFNEANLEAMLKSEMLSWPVTLAILVAGIVTFVYDVVVDNSAAYTVGALMLGLLIVLLLVLPRALVRQ